MNVRRSPGNRLKILFIARWYPNRYDPQMGVFIRKHAVAVAKVADVALLHVFSDDKKSDRRIELVSENQNNMMSVVAYFKKYSHPLTFVSKTVNFFRYWKATGKGMKHIRNNFGDHDLTHAYILLRPAIIASYFQLFSKKPFVISEQWSGYATGKYARRNIFVKWLSGWVVKRANGLTVVSKFLKNHMIRNGLKGQYTIIPNIVEVPSQAPLKSVHSKVKMLLVADLVDEIKNVSGVIKAIGEIVSTYPNLELHIIGHGVDKNKLTELAARLNLLDRFIFFHGLKSNAEVYESLQQSDFLVMNSRYETFSLICAEAIACGKPVVATRCGGPQEFVTDETGILFEPGNQQELIVALKKMLETFRNYSADQLIAYARKRFSAEQAAEKFLDVYQSIFSKK